MLADKILLSAISGSATARLTKKFKYDIVTDYSAKDIFDKAVASKQYYHAQMFTITKELRPKYFLQQCRPIRWQAIKMMIDKIALNHASPEHLVDTINKQVNDLKRFIIEKDFVCI